MQIQPIRHPDHNPISFGIYKGHRITPYGECVYGKYKDYNLEILDADGNSLLEAAESSTGLPLYIGDSNIQAAKLGDIDISKMYIGDTLIYGT